jgi:hypothetical protein
MLPKVLVLCVALIGSASAQTTVVTTAPALEVQRLAPQLVAFAGGEVNFANLANGLALGVPVSLTTPLGAGATQVVTFTPAGTMSPLQVAQTLEAARQSLITRGVAAPSAQQIGVTLFGGQLQTASGNVQTPALVQSATVLVSNTLAQPANTASAPLPVPSAAAGGTTVRNTSDSPLPRNTSDTPPSPATGTVRNMSDSPLPRGISDTPPRPVPGVTGTR